MHWDTFKQDHYSTVGGDGGSRVSKGMSQHYYSHARPQGSLATVTVRDPPTTFLSEFAETKCKSLIVVQSQASQWHQMFCHDPEVMSSNPRWVDMGVHSPTLEVRLTPNILTLKVLNF